LKRVHSGPTGTGISYGTFKNPRDFVYRVPGTGGSGRNPKFEKRVSEPVPGNIKI
jgi:hypothetical protein